MCSQKEKMIPLSLHTKSLYVHDFLFQRERNWNIVSPLLQEHSPSPPPPSKNQIKQQKKPIKQMPVLAIISMMFFHEEKMLELGIYYNQKTPKQSNI